MPLADEIRCQPLRASEFNQIRKLAYDTFGLDLRAGKESLVSTRLGKYIQQSGCRSFDEYYRHVVGDSTGQALVHLIDALTTNHTSFFREPAHFDFLRTRILPEWKNRGPLAIWSAACSTGEEPYSIAMCLLEELGSVSPCRFRILATDISTRVLAKARKESIRPSVSGSSRPRNFRGIGCAASASRPATTGPRRKCAGWSSSAA